MSADAENAAPLTGGSDRPASAGNSPAAPPKSRRCSRRCLICGGSCVAVLVILGVVVLVLALTVFRVKDPSIRLNNLSIDRLSVNLGNSISQPLSINMTIVSDLSIKNPNAVSFRFAPTATRIYHRGQELGIAYGPPGNARAHRTLSMNVSVDVMADRVAGDRSLFGDLIGGSLPIMSSTMVSGRAKLLGSIRRHVDLMMNCSFTVAVANQSILDQTCQRKVWL